MDLVARFNEATRSRTLLEACSAAVNAVFPCRGEDGPRPSLRRLCRYAGIEVRKIDRPDFEGKLERDCDLKPIITLARGREGSRAAFTLAHELGHWVIQETLGEVNQFL